MKLLKRFLLALLLVPGALVIAIIIIISVIDPNDYRQELEQLVVDQGKVRVALDGEISWKLYPHIGFSIEDATVYQSLDLNKEFASIGETVVSLALIPLLSANVEIKGIIIDKLTAVLEVDAQGQANWQQLIAQEQTQLPKAQKKTNNTPAQQQSTEKAKEQTEKALPLQNVRIESLYITNTKVSYKDKQANQSWLLDIESFELDDFSFGSAFPVNAVIRVQGDSPELQASLDFSSQVRINAQLNRIKLSDMKAELTAQTSLLPGGSQRISLSNSADIDLEKSHFSLPLQLQADVVIEQLSPDRQKVELDAVISGNYSTLQLQAQQLKLDADFHYPSLFSGRQNISLSTSLASVDLQKGSFSLPLQLQADVVLKQLSSDKQNLSINTALSGNYNKLQLQAKQLKLNADLDYPSLFSQRQQVSLSAPLLDVAVLEESIKVQSALLKLDSLEAKITAAIQGFATPRADADISIASFNPRDLLASIQLDDSSTASSLIPEMAGKQSLTAVALDAKGSFGKGVAQVKALKLVLDKSTLQGNAQYTIDSNTVIANLKLDTINLDNYLPAVAEKPKDAGANNKESTTSNKAGKKLTPADLYSKDLVIPLELLNLIYADVKIAAGAITIRKENISKVQLMLNNTQEKTQAALKAKAFTGNIDLKAALAHKKTPNISLKSELKNVDLQRALAMLQDEKLVGGKGNVSTQLSLSGNSVYDWVNSVSGPLSVSLKQGRLYGFNLTKELCSAVVKLDGRTPRTDGWDEFTAINQLDLVAQLNKGNTLIESLKLGLIDARGQAKGEVNLPNLDFRVPLEIQITGDTEDGKCKANPTLLSLSWPLVCKGNALSTDPVDFCRPDLDLIQSRIAGQLQEKIDAEKAKLKAKLNAEKEKLKAKANAEKEKLQAKAEAEKAKLQQKADDKKRQAQAAIDAKKAELEQKKKAAEDKLKAQIEQKKKDEENILKDKLKDKLKSIF